MKPFSASDFRAKRLMLKDTDFAVTPVAYRCPTNLIQKATWKSIVSLPDDVSIRTSDRYGPQLQELWKYWGIWGRIVLAVQDLSKYPPAKPGALVCEPLKAARRGR